MRLSVYIQPGAKKTETAGMHDGMIKIRISSPPVEGAANKALIKFISKKLKISKNSVKIASGEKSRNKILEIESDAEEVFKALGIHS